jgi:ABC-type multidrug transport system permease subunit
MRRIRFLAWAEVLHVIRDRATLAQVLVLPLAQLLILSNAATFEVRDVPTYVVDFDRSTASRGLVDRFAASGNFDIVGDSTSLDLANDELLRGRVTLVVTVPHDFERSLMRDRAAPIQLAVNAEKGSAAGVVQSYALRILSAYSAELGTTLRPTMANVRSASRDQPPMRGATRIEVTVRNRYNQTLNYKHYMVPGLLVALVTLIATLVSAQNIAREKELGTLEQLNVTPLTRGQFIAAKLLPFWVLGMLDLGIGLTAGWLIFDIPVRGSLVLLFGSAAVYLVVALAIGLWISTLVETQQQAMFVTFFIVNIYLLMSGLFTPIDSMSPWVQTVSLLNPVRHFVTISRALLVKGAGLQEIVQPLAILALFAVVTLALAIRQYSKRTA